ncbi:unnamed protein product [Dovyalis caffra]|uniref:Uncharacterized protein n=1 Tax=Dovyalis caffra TaxID=77055 RepID=A0AAV1QPW3_9ROSI|nr:unnamed protein product [Dovyalis caffra]
MVVFVVPAKRRSFAWRMKVNGDSAVERAASFLLDRGASIHQRRLKKSALRTVLDSHLSHGSHSNPTCGGSRGTKSKRLILPLPHTILGDAPHRRSSSDAALGLALSRYRSASVQGLRAQIRDPGIKDEIYPKEKEEEKRTLEAKGKIKTPIASPPSFEYRKSIGFAENPLLLDLASHKPRRKKS